MAERRWLDAVLGVCLSAGKGRILAVAAWLVALIAFSDWSVGRNVSLGFLYILPMMLAAVVLRPWETASLAILCSLLRSAFDTPGSQAEVMLRFVFATLAYFSSGLFVTALVRNRELVLDHLAKIEREQGLRREAEEQLSILVESSPAGILTLDERGVVVGANRAAHGLFGIPESETLDGHQIENYLPVLSDALRVEIGPEVFRTAAQCQGRRDNGEIFLANTWFSSYVTPTGKRLAAIVVDSSEEMREREETNLLQLLRYNRVAASAVSHEVLNLSSSIALLMSALGEKHGLYRDEDYEGLATLVQGLEKIAAFELHLRANDTFEAIPLKPVLDNLRIMIEPDWRDVDGTVNWQLPSKCPSVVADAHGLLQGFLNLAKNSLRAVQGGSTRELRISLSVSDQWAAIRFEDCGPGIEAPERLFQPFQPGADGTGLGLYISRAIVRSYGGDLRFEQREKGSCFVVELQLA